MVEQAKRRLSLNAILVSLLILCLLGGLWLLISSISVSGTATLPNGVPVAISSGISGYSASNNDEFTRIEIAGYKLEFDNSRIQVDGVEVGAIDDSMTQIRVIADRGVVTLADEDKIIWSSE